jgi:signal peptidase I
MTSLRNRLFPFHGRISRWDYWKYSLPVLAAEFIVLGLILFLSCLYVDSATNPSSILVYIFFAALIITVIVFTWIVLALQVKRLHDRGMSGWLVFAALVPVLGPLWLLFQTYVRRGRAETNRFGPPETSDRKLTTRAGLGFGMAIIAILAVIVAGRTQAVESFYIPSGGNVPTLLSGDFVFVFKAAYSLREPRRGDMVAFNNPHTGDIYVKRLVALAGDKVQVTNGVLIVNGEPSKRVRVADYQICDWDEAYDRPINEWRYHYVETMLNGVAHDILGNVTAPQRFSSCIGMPPEPPPVNSRPEDAMPVDNTAVFEVPPDHFFAIGDNRDNSADSRLHLGYVPIANLLGPVELVYFSSARWLDIARLWSIPTSIRWERFPAVVR